LALRIQGGYQRRHHAALALLCLLPMLASAYDPDPAALPGASTCVAGACPDEAIAFTRDESRLIDRSWLLDRPALMNCRWTLTGQR